MEFRFTATIHRPPSYVFDFFRDIDQHAGRKGTRVPVYDKTTPGTVGLGTRYREVVQLPLLARGEIMSEITEYCEGERLGYRFSGLGMDGTLTYSSSSGPWNIPCAGAQSASKGCAAAVRRRHWQDVFRHGWTEA